MRRPATGFAAAWNGCAQTGNGPSSSAAVPSARSRSRTPDARSRFRRTASFADIGISAFERYEKEHGPQSYFLEKEFLDNGRENEDYDPYLWIRPLGDSGEETWDEITMEDAVNWTDERSSGDFDYTLYVRSVVRDNAEEAIAEYRKNPSWCEIYDNAPRGAKEFLKRSFVQGYLKDKTDGLSEDDEEELHDRLEELRRTLKVVDWEYLIAHAGTGGDAAMDKRDCEKCLAVAKEREALKRDRQNGSRLIRELRHAYKEWTANRMTDEQYNAEAHRIARIEARLEAANLIRERLSDQFHDLYTTYAYAVND